MSNYNFDYSILDVVNACSDIVIRINKSTHLDCDCPLCDGKGKLHIKISSDQFRCNKCGNSGGMLDLYMLFNNITSTKEAHKNMLKFIGKDGYERGLSKSRAERAKASEKSKASHKASVYNLNKTYRAFLELCVLKEKHVRELTSPKRGLNETQIRAFGFKSAPTEFKEHRHIVKELLKQNCVLKGVPGFFVDTKGKWNFAFFDNCEGIMTPVINLEKQVVGLQLRLDVPFVDPDTGKETRFIWFSTPYKKNGTGSGSPVHITNRKKVEKIYLTEGPIKAKIASSYSGKTFAAIAGVNCQTELKKFLQDVKARGCETIIDCFDMDYKYNPYVRKARKKLCDLVKNIGLQYVILQWNEHYKGIDDVLIQNKENRYFKYTVVQ